jgi:hypothetical protein
MLQITKNKATLTFTPDEYCVVCKWIDVPKNGDYLNTDFADLNNLETINEYYISQTDGFYTHKPIFEITKLERDQLLEAGFKEITK